MIQEYEQCADYVEQDNPTDQAKEKSVIGLNIRLFRRRTFPALTKPRDLHLGIDVHDLRKVLGKLGAGSHQERDRGAGILQVSF